ncbi:nicotinamide-nucleotide amidase [Vibrio hippocampi]|uniref:Nicotinamide-nucleotide amidohydrolase PncC n=1 Tax=Vibrio hippocampi TaxID=654686 RepID=A0ABM8ZEX7_9VIBR|nr:nicotinamide-nucleotide amidase [Vibrio hippocampi]CAH0524601.1 Nicotinamide-nucleotide amidohydrolase PncC [Vibrio hippocampi]
MHNIQQLSEALGQLLRESQYVLTTAESCTGGGIATAITDIAGSSAWFDRSFVTYSNEAKMEMLGVQLSTLETVGAVSEQTVIEMAQGALKYSHATHSIAISGIAGPGGGTDDKPVGTVCFAWADKADWQQVETCLFLGDRSAVRQQAIMHALLVLYRQLTEEVDLSH